MKTVPLSPKTRAAITWGRHESHGNVWLKLHTYSGPKNARRLKEGWDLAFMPRGEHPGAGL